MIRPSSLQLARDCRYSAELGEKYPETSDAAEDGTGLHAEVLDLVMNRKEGGSPRARIVADFVNSEKKEGDTFGCELPAFLRDPDTDDVITMGTSDCAIASDGVVKVIDYKFGRIENVPHPNDNWQLKAYGAALAINYSASGFIPIIVGERDGQAIVIRGDLVTNVSEIIDEIRTVNARQSAPKLGEHCSRCYRSKYCHAYQAQTKEALVIVDHAGDIGLDDDFASVLSQRIDQVEAALKAAKAIRRDYIARGGRVVVDGKLAKLTMQAGRESANVAALKADGLEQYVKRGEPFEKITWVKDK